jgi:large subunit ribosomal protein L5
MSRYKEKYQKEVVPALQKRFEYKNPMQLPRLQKIVIAMGVAEATKDRNVIEDHGRELTALSGQAPIVCHARTSVAGFKLREGQAIGLKVTLRGKRMYDFLDRLINISLPRVRDFRGCKPGGDGRGNYTMGLDTQEVFPEVDLDKMKRAQGMHITFVTSGTKDDEAMQMLESFGMPFKK